MLRGIAISLVFLTFSGGLSRAGTVRGQVPTSALSDLKTPPTGDKHFWTLPLSQQSAQTESALVVLENKSSKNIEIQRPPAKLTIKGYGVFPKMLAVRVGDELKINSLDDHPYSCTITGGPGPITLDGLSSKKPQTKKFMVAGLLTFSCKKYPFIRASIVVSDSPFSAITDPTGQFQMQRVPPGEYIAKVFAAGKLKWEKKVEVSSASNTNLSLEPAGKTNQGQKPDAPVAVEKPKPKSISNTNPPKETTDKKPPSQRVNAHKQVNRPAKTAVPANPSAKSKKKPPINSVKDKPTPKRNKPNKSGEAASSSAKKKPVQKKKPAKEKPAEGFKDVEPEIEIEVE